MLRYNVLVAISLALFACAKSEDGARCQLDGDCDGSNSVDNQSSGAGTLSGTISCTAQSSKSIYAHGDTVGIVVNASGGTGVYSVPGFVSSFSGSTTFFIGSYNNFGTTDRAVEKSVAILDSAGRSTSCNFRFTVNPSTTSTGNTGLACGITASKYNPMVGESVTFSVKAAGGKTPYSFGQFYPRQGEAPKNLASINGADASVTHAYGWVGYADPAVKVTDANGSSVWCEIPNRYTQILPITPATVWASQSSGNVDADGNATDPKNLFLVKLSVSGFSGTAPVQFSYVSSEAGVSIKQNLNWQGSNTFFIKRLDNLYHDFNIVFTASNGSQSDDVSVNIKFADNLACYVDEPLYLYKGVEGVFKVHSYSGTDALEISEVLAASGVITRKTTNGNAAELGLTFNNEGYYEVKFKARSRTDALKNCNGGNDYRVEAYVLPPPSTLTACEVKANLDSVNVGSPLKVDVTRKGGSVNLYGYVVTLTPNGSSTLIAGPYLTGPDTSTYDLKLNEIKTYTLAATLREVATGKVVSCSTQVDVVSRPGLLTAVYQLPRNAVNGATISLSGLPKNQADFISPNINVSPRRSDCNDCNYFHRKKYGFSSECEYPGVYGRKEWFAIEYTGYIKAPVTGTYYFKFEADDGVALYINGTNVLTFDGLHAPQTTPTSLGIHLTAGDHTIRVRYFQGPKWEVANRFYWLKPGGFWEIVPAGRFRQP